MLVTNLIIGLGNPGREYRNTRHNIGFLMIDALAQEFNTSFSRVQFNALITSIKTDGSNLFLAKPQTFMNRSDRSVVALVKFYKLDLHQIMIVNDDIDLPLGTIRIRGSGGSGGQKGVNSIIEGLGTRQFPRLRMGIGRPSGRISAASYVLKDFKGDEIPQVNEMVDRAVEAVILFTKNGIEAAMTKYNG